MLHVYIRVHVSVACIYKGASVACVYLRVWMYVFACVYLRVWMYVFASR